MGTTINYFSSIEKVDEIFATFIPGLTDYLEQHQNGEYLFDARIGYTINEKARVLLLVKNLTNQFYALRPGKFDAPRNVTLQFSINI